LLVGRAGCLVDMRNHVLEYEIAYRLDAPVKVHGRDDRLEHRRGYARRKTGTATHPLSQGEHRHQIDFTADLGADLPADDRALDFGHLAFEEFRVITEEILADDEAQDRVAKKLHPL